MANFYADNEDLKFYFEHYIDWRELVALLERNGKAADAAADWKETAENYKSIIDLMGEFVSEQIAPQAAKMDLEGTHLKDGVVQESPTQKAIFDQLREMGVFGVCSPREFGGMNCPDLIYFMLMEIIGRACVSSMTHFGFYASSARTLLHYALNENGVTFDKDGNVTKTRWEEEIRQCAEGNGWGSMDLTEPSAGSDLTRIKARATQEADGSWRITGNKIFITSGHAPFHFVLAKTDDREDLDAISLFFVPQELRRDGKIIRNITIDRVEEKIGHHASATCSLVYDNSEAQLVGNEGDGFKLMLKIMNHARITVGFEGIGLCENAYRVAKDYAEDRVTMGLPIARHGLIAGYLHEMDIGIKAMRAMCMEAAICHERYVMSEYNAKALSTPQTPDAAKRTRKMKRRTRKLTPLIKYFASEQAVWMSRMAMQIHGGNGYTKDYAPERLLREALVMPVYEGTSQIQCLMAFKDAMGFAVANPQRFLQKAAGLRFKALRSTDSLERGVYKLKAAVYSVQQTLLMRVAKEKWAGANAHSVAEFISTFKKWDPKQDFRMALVHAENFTKILIDATAAEILLRQAKRFPERRKLLEQWLEMALPRVRYHQDLIENTGHGVMERMESESKSDPVDLQIVRGATDASVPRKQVA